MEKFNNEFLTIIEKDGNCVNYKKDYDSLGHMSAFEDYGMKNNIKFGSFSHEELGMTLAKLNLVSVLNAKAYHLVMLPEQLTEEQIKVLEENKEYFDQSEIIRTEVYTESKTDYGERYRKLHKEDYIYRTNLSDVDQLYKEISRQKEMLKSKQK